VPPVQNNTAHAKATARRNLTYVFTPKHHGGDKTASCWLPALTFDEEFAIFDRSDGIVVQSAGEDDRHVADNAGNLYGYETVPGGSLRELGTWHQQMAEFPVQPQGAQWHGYPIWPIGPQAPPNKQGQKCRPDAYVFDRMVQLGDISSGQGKRLKKGDWI
jgi:hypothetical protein